MKFLLFAVLTGFVLVNPAIAENTDERHEDKERQERKERRKRNPRKFKQELPKQWQILRSISGEERKRLRQLYAADPKAFRQELAKIVKRIRQKDQKASKDTKKAQQLVRQYKNTQDSKKKEEILKELREVTRKIFLTKMKHNKKRLESLEKQVKKLRREYDFRKKNAEKIIQARLDTLTTKANFNW